MLTSRSSCEKNMKPLIALFGAFGSFFFFCFFFFEPSSLLLLFLLDEDALDPPAASFLDSFLVITWNRKLDIPLKETAYFSDFLTNRILIIQTMTC